MADISNKTLGFLVVVALLVSAFGLFSLQNGGITGLGITGTTRINITATAAVNVTKTTVDFGNSTIQGNAFNCTITTETATQTPSGCWGGTYNLGGFRVVNVGNVQTNVTVVGTRLNATSFFGVAGGRYTFRCVVGAANGTSVQTTYTKLNTTAKACVSFLEPAAGLDGFSTHVNITIPGAASGVKTDTVTFTATRACASSC